MRYERTLRLSELNEYIDLIKLEQSFRAKLHEYKSFTEYRLAKLKELKPIAEKLKNLKQLIRNKGVLTDKELDKEIRNIINKKFIGGVV